MWQQSLFIFFPAKQIYNLGNLICHAMRAELPTFTQDINLSGTKSQKLFSIFKVSRKDGSHFTRNISDFKAIFINTQ